MTGRKDQDEEKTDESRSLPVDQDFGPQDAQLPFHDGPEAPSPHLEAGETPQDTRPVTEPLTGRTPSRTDDAVFLAEAFDINEAAAAELVAPGEDSADIAAEAREQRDEADRLAGVPTPEEPEQDLVADQDEVRLKPVLHTRGEGPGRD
jgi:hypothetical protein